ncbi:MAG: hypothetical protein BWY31_01567 [Lentisphaerae bacterium ADurb.Bin242]|nr:MAG: hypothetical protein BWY31_01567 [Lentisphaerae bacterium ADurb.Bin242]
MSQIRVCKRCRKAVTVTRTPDYSYACPEHDEDLYEFETEFADTASLPTPYTNVTVQLVNTDGNAFALLGKVRQAMRRAKYDTAFIEGFSQEAMAGS